MSDQQQIPTILIIDDNIKNIQLAANVLKNEYKIIYATSAKQGIELLQRHDVSLILMDVMMPEMDGFQATRQIKQNERFQELPIIFLTANDDDDSLEKAFVSGGIDFIAKPFKAMSLKLRVKTQIELYVTKCKLKEHLAENIQLLKQYKDIVDMSTIVSKADLSGLITYVNRAFEEISGYSSDELIGRPHSVVRHPDMPKEVFAQMWKAIRNKEVFSATIKNMHKDGSAYYVRSYIAPILDAHGEIKEYISIRQDITSEMKSLEHEKEVNELKDEFLRNLSHEVRTPLNAIEGFSSILDLRLQDETLKGYVTGIRHGSKAIMALMDNLVQLAQLKSDSYQVRTETVDLSEVLNNTLERYQAMAREKGIDYRYHIDDELKKRVVCDCNVIEKIIENLVDNSIKFTDSEGNVDVDVSLDDMLMIVVKDSGIGIAEEEQEKVFDLFYQVDGSTARMQDGLGIGLTMVEKLVERLGGTIELHSHPGQGTRFKVTLPIVVE